MINEEELLIEIRDILIEEYGIKFTTEDLLRIKYSKSRLLRELKDPDKLIEFGWIPYVNNTLFLATPIIDMVKNDIKLKFTGEWRVVNVK